MKLQDFPNILIKNRETLEAMFVFSLWKQPELYYDYKHINNTPDSKTLLTPDGVFYFQLGKQMYERGYRVFDDLTVYNHLQDNNEIKKMFNDKGGMDAVNDLMSFVNPDNIIGAYDDIVKANILLRLYDKGFNVLENLETLKPMSSEEVYYYFDYQLNNLAISTSNNVNIENLDIDDEFIEECNVGFYKGIDYSRGSKILNGITMGLPLGELFMIGGFSGTGKALDVNTPIITPKGKMAMKYIKLGQYVIGKDGKKAKVKGVFYQGVRPCVEIFFNDGRSIVCDYEHLWMLSNGDIIDTKALIERYNAGEILTIPIQGVVKDTEGRQPTTYSSQQTPPVIHRMLIYGEVMKRDLQHSYSMHLPREILKYTLKVRNEIGLAIFNGNNNIREDKLPKEFFLNVMSKRMAEGLRELYYTLGYRVKLKKIHHSKFNRGYSYFLKVYNNQSMEIVNIRDVGLREVQCISVDTPDNTYLCGDYIVTHNTSFVFENMLLPIKKQNIKCAILSNEQRSRDFKMLLMSHILTHDLKYYELTRRQLKFGKFTESERQALAEAKEVYKKKYQGIKFIKLNSNNMSEVLKIIRRLSQVGYQMFLFDTMKSDDRVDEAMWQQLLLNSRKLHQLASRNNIAIVCTYQLALSKLNTRYLDASCLSNAKQIKEVFSEMVYMRKLFDDEYSGENYDIKPYQLEMNTHGEYTGKRLPITTSPDKEYRVLFVDKTRNDNDGKQILYEFMGDYNTWKEIGMCKVLNIANAKGG